MRSRTSEPTGARKKFPPSKAQVQVRLAQAEMAHRDTSVSTLCAGELGIRPVTAPCRYRIGLRNVLLAEGINRALGKMAGGHGWAGHDDCESAWYFHVPRVIRNFISYPPALSL